VNEHSVRRKYFINLPSAVSEVAKAYF